MVGENEAVVVWTTDKKALSWVEVAPDDGTHFYACQRDRYYETSLGKKVLGTLHKVKIDGLTKGTCYRYRILSKEVVAEEPYRMVYGDVVSTDVFNRQPLKFRTADREAASTRFAVVNDIHGNNDKLKSLLGGVGGQDDCFVVFNGDMIDFMESEKQVFEGFVDTSVRLFASEVPFYMARGNHETRGAFAGRFMDYFPTSTGLPYYCLRRGPVCLVVLDSGEDKPDEDVAYSGVAAYDDYRAREAEWLRRVVESEDYKSAAFRVVVMHMPPVDGTWHGMIHVAEQFMPILNKAGVDLMLCGHIHAYAYNPPGQRGSLFPVIVNSTDLVVRVKADNKDMSVEVADTAGEVRHRYSYKAR